jgi:mannose/fructose/N-acetylgalactosamine-specific phosphotransferase system component IIC
MPGFDLHTAAAVLGLAVWTGLVGLDRTAAGQFMVSQPIVTGPLTGLLLGDAAAGFVIGAVLELLWVLDLPVGSFVPADATISTAAATGVAVLGSPGGAPLPVIGFSVLLTTALVPVTMTADRLARTRNSRLLDRVAASSGKEMGRALARAQATGLWTFFLKSFVVCCLAVPLGVAAVRWFVGAPPAAHRAFELFVKVLPILGTALVVRKLSVSNLDRYFLAGFAGAAVLGQGGYVPAPLVLAAAAGASWLGARYRESRP